MKKIALIILHYKRWIDMPQPQLQPQPVGEQAQATDLPLRPVDARLTLLLLKCVRRAAMQTPVAVAHSTIRRLFGCFRHCNRFVSGMRARGIHQLLPFHARMALEPAQRSNARTI